MLQGRRPFVGDSPVETMNAVLTQEPPTLTQASPLIDQIVRHCLEKEPGERFQSARDLGFQLRLARHPSAQVLPAAAPLRRRPVLVAIASLVIATAAIGAAIVWWPSRQQPSASAPTPTITRLTSYSGLTTDAALSPDGTLLAYASDRASDGNLDIWLQQIGQAEAIRLTNDSADDREPSFSPDGRRIVFRSERDGGGVYVVSTLGGAASRIAPGGRQPRFSPDGARIAYWVGLSGRVADGGTRTYVVGANGGSPTQVATDLGIARHPLWTPDGQQLLVLGSSEATNDTASRAWDWWITSLEKRPARRTGAFDVLRSHGLVTSLPIPSTWDPERGILFAADLGDTRNIWQLRLAPGDWRAAEEPRRLTSGAAIEDLPAAAAGRVVFASFTENADIWSLPVDARRGTVTGTLARLTDNVAVDVQPGTFRRRPSPCLHVESIGQFRRVCERPDDRGGNSDHDCADLREPAGDIGRWLARGV
jgi:hypothetical protein